MTPRTLRRKLQKKLKHKPYRKCLKCGNRMNVKLRDGRLLVECGAFVGNVNRVFMETGRGCGHWYEIFWSGGGDGRHIPSRSQG